ncbi:hypothetical protein [Rodentibacter pneumotropicus]|nr:hypothetical protein [Rodentibacter pneumotropicus]
MTALFLISLFWLGTEVSPSDYLTYIPIWAMSDFVEAKRLDKKQR